VNLEIFSSRKQQWRDAPNELSNQRARFLRQNREFADGYRKKATPKKFGSARSKIINRHP
jgi:hypothetical protein